MFNIEKLLLLIVGGGFGGILFYTVFGGATEVVLLGVIIAFLIDFKLGMMKKEEQNSPYDET
ncbi:hypothetical protein CFK37_17600 [Virgibacillus phasianinus]|uniref:DUF2273 domain-containing protein n=1 Tax=Virgibacillus phasianinus TaxID=2017483 RepID=A0A220U7X0_9BACI|nr:hypothetical protein [Virgibacillus phasianinus]ASK63843.1 hypothetical protein CFK37_17600 [Virgibacillus phasianinus]